MPQGTVRILLASYNFETSKTFSKYSCVILKIIYVSLALSISFLGNILNFLVL